jgi:hypothetical protein
VEEVTATPNNDPQDRQSTPYSGEELAILKDVANRFNVPQESLLELVNLELGFHRMGRRRGLFPAMRAVVATVANRPKESG